MMNRFLYGIGCSAFVVSSVVMANEPQYVYPPASGSVSAVPVIQQPMAQQGMLPVMPYAYPQINRPPMQIPMGGNTSYINPYVAQQGGQYFYPQVNPVPMQGNQQGRPVYPPAPANVLPNVNPYQGLPGGTPGPYRPPPPKPTAPTKPWGDTRYIWPDFYTDFTGDFWDKMINAPYEMGYMPGGWRFPSFSSPDPITVGDAVANQVPPIMEEVPNFIDFAN